MRSSNLGYRAISREKCDLFCGSAKEQDHFRRAFSKVAFVEIGDPKESGHLVYGKQACELYTRLFPNDDEREPWEVITNRLEEMSRIETDSEVRQKYGDSRFHAVVAVSDGKVVGYSQASTLPVGDKDVLVYWQYGGVEKTFRIQGIASAYYPIRHGMAAMDAKSCGRNGNVLGTLIETEFIGQALEPEDIQFTRTRLTIHHKSGMMAMMLDMGEGIWVTAHIQPRLSEDKEPIILQALYRPLNLDGVNLHEIREIDPEVAHGIMMAFMGNFDCEGFDPRDVQDGRGIINDRFRVAKRVLLVPPEQLPNIVEFSQNDPLLKAQVEREYGPLEEHRRRISDVLK